MTTPTFDEIVQDAMTLVRDAAKARRGMVSLSPETAKLITGLGGNKPVPVEPVPRADSGEIASALDALAKEVSGCTKCELCKKRTQTVFGVGNPTSKLVFVGEAPGEDEDRQGIPFVGRAGGLLTDIIEKGMKIPRDEVYICNVIKCRPPNNRDPLPEEKVQCEPYLVRQLELIKPRVICALGLHAAHSLLRIDDSLARMRGRWHFYQGIPVRVTYHPAYLLRLEGEELKKQKTKTWEDIQQVIRVYSGLETPTP